MNVTERSIKQHEDRLAVMLAHQRGERIEFQNVDFPERGWKDSPAPHWWWNDHSYRIAPKEPRKFRLAVSKSDGSAITPDGSEFPSTLWEMIDAVEVIPEGNTSTTTGCCAGPNCS